MASVPALVNALYDAIENSPGNTNPLKKAYNDYRAGLIAKSRRSTAKSGVRPCAACSDDTAETTKDGTIVVEAHDEQNAEWLAQDEGGRLLNPVRLLLDEEGGGAGFRVRVRLDLGRQDERLKLIWHARPRAEPDPPRAADPIRRLPPSGAPVPGAREAYTGSPRGHQILHWLDVGAMGLARIDLTLPAPMPYHDADPQQKAYNSHVHAYTTKGRVLTLPYLIPECGARTAKLLSADPGWKPVYVLGDRVHPPLGDLVFSLQKLKQDKWEFRRQFPDLQTPLLLYCKNSACPASHEFANILVRELGYVNVHRFPGGVDALLK